MDKETPNNKDIKRAQFRNFILNYSYSYAYSEA